MNVLEHKRRGLLARDRLDEDPHGEEELLAVLYDTVGIEPEQDRKVPRHRFVGDALLQLRKADVGRVALEDPAQLLDLGREREVGAALAVRQRAPVDGAAAELLHDAVELLGQPRLPDSRRAEDGDQVRDRLAGNALPGSAQDIEFAATPYEISGMVPLAGRVALTDGDPGFHRVGLPLGLDRRCLLVLDRVARGLVRPSTREHAADRSGRLQARGRVDDVPGNHRLAELRPRPERDERLSGVDGDPNLNIELAEPAHAVAHGHRCPHGPLGVVAVSGRRPEDGHNRVADELLDYASERLELLPDEVVIRAQERPDVLRVELLGARREADEVDEDNGDDPPLVPPSRRPRVERLPAGETEFGDLGVLLAAVGAGEHVLSVRCAAASFDPATLSDRPGGVPEWPKGTGCKPVGSAYGGSNPPAPTSTQSSSSSTTESASPLEVFAQGLSSFGSSSSRSVSVRPSSSIAAVCPKTALPNQG